MKQGLWVACIGVGGCAPVYVPNLARAPQLEAQGDVHLAAQGSLQGVQLDAAYAAGPTLALRGGAHVQYGEGVRYQLGTLGAGAYHATPGGLRLAGWLDAGAGHARGRSELTISNSSSTRTTVYLLQGVVFQVTATAELGWEHDGVAAGGELRLVEHIVRHDAVSEADTRVGDLTAIEPLGFVRVGTQQVKVQFFTGLTLPLRASGDVGVPLPIVAGLGLVWDFSQESESRAR